MFTFQRLAAALITAARIHLAVSFQPGSDYDVYKTTSLYNCTGKNPLSNVTLPNVFDTLPQIDSSSGHGWEQWSLFVHGTYPMILRWNQGNPSGPEASLAHFDILVGNISRSIVQATVEGTLFHTNDGNVKQIAIGDNSLTWDSDALWYNVSVSIDGYQMNLDSFSATIGAFHPNVDFYNGLLDKCGSWFGSVPLIRGQVVGSLSTPTASITLDGLSVIRHMFSENPLPSYITQYSGGTIWGYSKGFYDSHVFYQTETVNGTVHQATYLGRSILAPGQERVFSSTWATYVVTDDDLYTLSVDIATNEINASFSGCSNTNNIPYEFNITSLALLGEFVDLGGGATWYYSISGTTAAPFNGTTSKGAIAGIFEEYQAPH